MLTHTTYSQKITTSVQELNEQDWNTVLQQQNIYLSIPYLKALANTMGDDMDFLYAISYQNNTPVLIAVFQLVNFVNKRQDGASKVLKKIAGETTEKGEFSMNILVCGNVFSDGENGFVYSNNITSSEAINRVASIAQQIKKDKIFRKKLSLILFKEFFPQSVKYTKELKHHNYRDFMIDVNMVLPIHPSWKTMDDYLLSMKTKYRTRAKSVLKKGKNLVLKSLTANEITQYSSRIDELFHNVLGKSEYSFGVIKASAFKGFKQSLDDNFSFRGVFLEDKLVGFSTAFFHKNITEANYVGIDYTHNQELAIYQRLLYDYVEQAIQTTSTELQLGRTSELIKSALGAVPVNMTLYTKHKKAISNMLMSSILCFISPSKFELRQPFKANFIK